MPSTSVSKPAAGGSAAERGMDFQARVGAIVIAHLLAERPLGWLDGVLGDIPTELDAETGGPGDDIRFITRQMKCVELQAKRGLQRSPDLWEALLSLAKGISVGTMDSGILAVCPNSSGTIRSDLSEDIVRLGSGRSDGLREIGRDFVARLAANSLDIRATCSRLRIVVVSAVDGNREAEATASERMGRVIRFPEMVWETLVAYSRQLIRTRGRCTSDQIYRKLVLAGASLKLEDVETRMQLQAAVRRWLQQTYEHVSMLGVQGKVSFDECWISLDAHLLDGGLIVDEELDKALKQYHAYADQPRTSDQSFTSHTIGRFVHKSVVVGGPGIGKSTLLKKLALEYSRDGYLTLLVRLPLVIALLTREGRRFEDSVLEVALSGSGVRAPSTSLDGAVILCDGLDECGNQQSVATAALHAFSQAHPRTRIVVSTRPIGYWPGDIGHWRHYELQPLKDTEAEKALERVLNALPFANEQLRRKAVELATEQLRAKSIKEAASRSPLMLTLLAALSSKGIDPGSGKAALYRQLFGLIEGHPPPRLFGQIPSEPERNRFLELLGWSSLAHGNEPIDQTLDRCAEWWSAEMGTPRLASEARVHACCDYWESLGVVERVRTLRQEAITFVHKTFGEFAAARYIYRRDGEERRTLIARAIQTPAWKEALSFASHLGMASLILEVWAELANAGDAAASHSLDDATELVVQAGVPINASAMDSFTACCWKATENTVSRSRYAAGEALCIASKEHWPLIRAAVLARMDDPDNWIKLVAWTCLSASPEPDIPFKELLIVLGSLNGQVHGESSFKFFNRDATGRPVQQRLVLSAARRILQKGPDPEGLAVLTTLLAQETGGMSVSAVWELGDIFREYGLTIPLKPENDWREQALLWPTREVWNKETAYLLDVLDTPSLQFGEEESEDISRSWELGALLTASNFWQMPLSEVRHMSAGPDATLRRRLVMHGVAKAVDMDASRLASQVRFHRRQIVEHRSDDTNLLFNLPRVDTEANFENSGLGVTCLGELEEVILGSGQFFALSAASLMLGLRDHLEYETAVSRLLAKGRGESMWISAMLANALPETIGQPMLLKRLADGQITSGCRYLYSRLKPPFDERHVDAVRRALDANVATAAKAAAEFAVQLRQTPKLANELREYFIQWMSKEEPYPKKGGTVPDSPRDALANILALAFSDEHEFLMELAKDERPAVRAAAQRSLVTAAALSPRLRRQVALETGLNKLDPKLLQSLVSAGVYASNEGSDLLPLLSNGNTRVRQAALPVLDVKYLPIELARTEGERLLLDPEMDIREAASQALRKLPPAASGP